VIDTCEYRMSLDAGAGIFLRGELVRGFQIGRFAVRAIVPGTIFRARDGSLGYPRAFTVDHIETGASVAHFSMFGDAFAFADEISRFALSDPDARDVNALIAQLGRRICEWADICRGGDTFIPLPHRQRQQQQEGTS
jgi:hypothetical protein